MMAEKIMLGLSSFHRALESVYNMTRDQNLFSSGGISIWGMASNSTIICGAIT